MFWSGGPAHGDPSAHPLLDEFRFIDEMEQQLDIPRGTPILVSPTGQIDPRLTHFFSSPTFAQLSAGSRLSYGKDLRLWLAYLDSRGTDWADASQQDLLRYKVWRRRRDLNPAAVSGTKWNRERAALLKLYRWASHPARAYVLLNPLSGDEDIALELYDKDAVSSRVKWATPRTYRLWRDVGVLGYHTNGRRDDSWRGRNSTRNRAFVDLLFGSGLRNQEASSLLTVELPEGAESDSLHEARVSRETAKRRARAFYLLDDSLKRVREYERTTRAAAVRRGRRLGNYSGTEWIHVSNVRASRFQALYFEGAWHDVNDIPITQRRRLLLVNEEGQEPLWLWLREDGLPFDPTSWDGVFDAANERVERVMSAEGHRTVVLTAHSLRHSFALFMLVALHRSIDRKYGEAPTRGKDYEVDRYRLAWDIVRDLLGHASITTTKETYLEPVNGIRLQEMLANDTDLDGVLSRLALSDSRVRDLEVDP